MVTKFCSLTTIHYDPYTVGIDFNQCIILYQEGAMTTKQVNPYPLRLDPEVGEWYKQQAKLSGRSFNSEIAKILVERRNRILGKQKSE